MADRVEALAVGGAHVQRPGVVGPAVGCGQLGVFDQTVRQQSERGVQKLTGDALLVQEGEAGLHVFQAVAGDGGQIERAESGAGLFLAIADQHAPKKSSTLKRARVLSSIRMV